MKTFLCVVLGLGSVVSLFAQAGVNIASQVACQQQVRLINTEATLLNASYRARCVTE